MLSVQDQWDSQEAGRWDVKLDDFNNDEIVEAVQAVGFVKGQIDRWPELGELVLGNDGIIKFPAFWPPILPGDDVSGHEQNPFYTRIGKQYVDISTRIGFGEDTPSRGVAVADVNGDGKLDMVVANMWGPSTYYHNECRECGNFLGLHLLLPVGPSAATGTIVRAGHKGKDLLGRPAIGAAVTVTASDGRTLTRQVDGGNGHTGKRSPDLHFGLGDQTRPVRVDIRWRDVNTESRGMKPMS